jgi:hypothetical protein
MGSGSVTQITVVVPHESCLLGELFTLVELMDEIHEEIRVLPMELSRAKTTLLLSPTNLVPYN